MASAMSVAHTPLRDDPGITSTAPSQARRILILITLRKVLIVEELPSI